MGSGARLLLALASLAAARALVLPGLLGRFDNREQAQLAAQAGTPTAALGGHEHVTFTGTPHPRHRDLLFASYCFADKPNQPFRFRLYKFPIEQESDEQLRMHIYKPSAACAQALQKNGFDLNVFLPEPSDFELLPGCDVVWRAVSAPREGHHGELATGHAYIPSAADPQVRLLVKDSLFVFADEIQINDQVFTMDGRQIIGNVNGVPYILRRRA